MDTISYYRLRKLASEDRSLFGMSGETRRTLSGIGGGIAGAVGANMAHKAIARHSPRYANFLTGTAMKAGASKGFGKWGRVAGLGSLILAPIAGGAILGSRGAKAAYDKLNDR